MKGIYKLNISDIDLSEHENVHYNDNDLIMLDGMFDDKQEQTMKLGFNMFIVCYQGKLQFGINGNSVQISAKQMSICPSCITIEDMLHSNDMKCLVLCFSDHLLHQLLGSYIEKWNNLMYINKVSIVDLSIYESYEKESTLLISLMRIYWEAKNLRYRSQIIYSLMQTILFDFMSIDADNEKLQDKDKNIHGKEYFEKFIDLLGQSTQHRHTVNYYANQLCLSSKYLSRICKNESGRTALEWIHEYVNQEISYFLLSSRLSIKEIANMVGFPNISAFGKYVRQVYGCSPSEYRESNTRSK